METEIEPGQKLNIYALPHQTTIIFGVIVVVLLGGVVLGSFGSAPVVVWPLSVGLLLLPLRAFWARPEREFERLSLELVGEAYPHIRQAIQINTTRLGLPYVPRLTINPQSDEGPRTLGSFRRGYIIMGVSTANWMENQLANPVSTEKINAILIHELYHFANGDHWKIGYAGELLRTTFYFIGWAIAFSFGIGLLLIEAASDFVQMDFPRLVQQLEPLSPQTQQLLLSVLPNAGQMAEFQQRAAKINMGLVLNFILSAFLPMVFTGLLLLKFYWPKLWRVREFYADAGVAHQQGTLTHLTVAHLDLPKFESEGHSVGLGQKLKDAFIAKQGSSSVLAGAFTGRRRGIFSFRPSSIDRSLMLKEPGRLYTWKDTALLVGSLTLLLDILLSSPLTLIYIGSWPIHFSVLVVYLLVSVSFLIPSVTQGKRPLGDLMKIVGVVVGLRLLWLLPTLAILFGLLFLAPTYLNEMLQRVVASVARFAGYSDVLGFDNLAGFVFEAAAINLAELVIIFLVLIVSLGAVYFMLQRLCTWYSLPNVESRLMQIAYLLIGLLGLFLAITVLPFLTTFLLRPSELMTPFRIFTGLVGVTIAISGLLFFRFGNRSYANRCPKCGNLVKTPFILGKKCATCHETLHTWLLVEYVEQ